MAGFRLDNFTGIRPRASDVRLAISEAITAVDVDLRRGFLRPRARQLIWQTGVDPAIAMGDGVTPETLYRFHRRSDDTDFWMYFTQDVDMVPGPAESEQQRHYYTGDGIPKMFYADSVDDTSPPYPQSADTKYPYTWFALGVPAPTTAPPIDADDVPTPSEGSVGLITSVTTPFLSLYVNGSYDEKSGLNAWQTNNYPGQDGRTAGLSKSNITAVGGSQSLTCLKTGLRVRVTEIVDADNVRVVASGRTGPIEDMGMLGDAGDIAGQAQVTGPAFLWTGETVARLKALSRLNSNYKRTSFFLLPEEVVLEVENHSLRIGDIIRITGASEAMTWASTPTMDITPTNSADWHTNYGRREASPDTTDDISFTGTVSFLIERDGASIDPVVPATSEFDVETRSYVYTYVTALGEESAPSPPSDPITIRVGDPVTILSFVAPPTERRNIDRIWLYRTNTGTEDTAFQFVDEIAVADIASGYEDTKLNEELGEVLESESWDVPDASMVGLVAMPNGILAGFFNNVLCFSEPGFPHAWPADYRKALDFDIVGLEVYGNALYVTTKGKPYVVVGVHPLQMSERRVETGQSNIDKRSLLNTGDRILYCAPEGLISASGGSFVNISDEHYTKEQWRRIVGPDNSTARSLRAWYFDGQYILLAKYTFNSEDVENKLVFDFRDKDLRLTEFTEPVVAAFADPETSELYYVVAPGDEIPGSDDATSGDGGGGETVHARSFILHLDGSNGATDIVDSGPNTYEATLNNGAALSTAQKALGSASVLLTGNDGGGGPSPYIGINVGDEDDFLTAEFTLEARVRFTNFRLFGKNCIFAQRNFKLYIQDLDVDGRTLRLEMNTVEAGPIDTEVPITVTTGQWYHFAATRTGNTVRVFVNGVALITVDMTDNPTITADSSTHGFAFGDEAYTFPTVYGIRFIEGYIDEARCIVGTSLYSTTFDPDTAFGGADYSPGSAGPARPLLRWDYEHPAQPVTEAITGEYTTGEIRLPSPMALSAMRVQCRRRLSAGGSMNCAALVQVSVYGRRYDTWATSAEPGEDDLLLLQDAIVINGRPGAGGWAGEQRSAPFRIPVNTLVDAVKFVIRTDGPVEVEAIQLGECMEDLEAS
jgi:hypothetical protein